MADFRCRCQCSLKSTDFLRPNASLTTRCTWAIGNASAVFAPCGLLREAQQGRASTQKDGRGALASAG